MISRPAWAGFSDGVVEEPRGEAVDADLHRSEAVGEDVQRRAVEHHALGVSRLWERKHGEDRKSSRHSDPDAASREQTTAMVL